MKFARITVRKLMLAVLALAAAGWTFEIASRRESYRLKARQETWRERQARRIHDSWTDVVARATKLQKENAEERKAGEIEILDRLIHDIYEHFLYNSHDYEALRVWKIPRSSLDARLREVIAVGRKNLAILCLGWPIMSRSGKNTSTP